MKVFLLSIGIALLWAGCQEIQSSPQGAPETVEPKSTEPKSTEPKSTEPKSTEPKSTESQLTRKSPHKITASYILQRLSLRSEQRDGYDRDAFEHWSDLDGNGCDAREDVLRTENLQPQGSVCWDDRGIWFSAYDGVRTSESSSFDVDHVVPLAEAWDSGARSWNSERRQAYANDLWPLALRAVSATSNRQKSDADPAEWMPPRQSFGCRYLLEWVAIKYRWGLSVDPVEKFAVKDLLGDCPRTSLHQLPPRP